MGLILAEPRYVNSKVHDFHRYAQVEVVSSFTTSEDAQAAVPEAERLMRLNPGPDVNLTAPVDEARQRRIVYALFVRLGPILTHWDPISRSVINETTPKHEMRDGFVIRQVACVDRNLYITTFGEGVNTTAVRAYLNGTLGPMPFHSMDVAINRALAAAKSRGFLDTGLVLLCHKLLVRFGVGCLRLEIPVRRGGSWVLHQTHMAANHGCAPMSRR